MVFDLAGGKVLRYETDYPAFAGAAEVQTHEHFDENDAPSGAT
jgi:hypothetical protein